MVKLEKCNTKVNKIKILADSLRMTLCMVNFQEGHRECQISQTRFITEIFFIASYHVALGVNLFYTKYLKEGLDT